MLISIENLNKEQKDMFAKLADFSALQVATSIDKKQAAQNFLQLLYLSI